jgi:hypothetical protein
MNQNPFRQVTVTRLSKVFASLCLLVLTAASVSARPATAQDNAAAAPQAASTSPTPASCGLTGHHALLERMAAAFSLTCEQILKIEPLLHEEESVSKPLEAFGAFSPDEKKAVMQELKVDARKRILLELTPDQQTKMNDEIDTVSKGGEGLQKGNSGGGQKKKVDTPAVDPFQAEEALSHAIANYSAFSDAEKKDLILKVRQASLRADAPAMTPDQAKQVNDEIKQASM